MKFRHIFILCTGRTGSMAIIRACQHITNYTSGHETRASELGEDRLAYPEYHIEGDNRLSWFLGKLSARFDSEDTLYIHLTREKSATVASYNKRWSHPKSIMKAFSEGILKVPVVRLTSSQKLQVCEDYYDAVNANIEHMLNNQPHTMEIQLENIKNQFPILWETIDATGDLEDALREFDVVHNRSKRFDAAIFIYKFKLLLLKLKVWN